MTGHGGSAATTLVELLRHRAECQGDRLAYTYLTDGEVPGAQLTYGQLDADARAIAALLQDLAPAGERALLLYPPGLELLSAFFGCLYAGIIAVPAYPPRAAKRRGPASRDARLESIARDASPALVLGTKAANERSAPLAESVESLARARWVSTDVERGDASGWGGRRIDPETIAFLQYTSGSTATPKGVVVSHRNLRSNVAAGSRAIGLGAESIGVSWLPLFHDMGLIGATLFPLEHGFRVVLMPPAAFTQRPSRWLEAISAHRATVTAAPSFAYQLCAEKVRDEVVDRLDLSSLSCALNGAEPVRSDVMERFARRFAPCGFRFDAFAPSYGLAEATLMVSGSSPGRAPVRWTVSQRALEAGRTVDPSPSEPARTLVGSGSPLQGVTVAIVDPETARAPAAGQVGEIWVRGDSVACGYWGRDSSAGDAFDAYLDGGDGPFLRTADLGVLHGGELFVTGRRGDLLVFRGRNYYSWDVEATVAAAHGSLSGSRGAAFAVETDGEERLVVVQEVPRRTGPAEAEELIRAIRRAVAEEHELAPCAVVLVRERSVPLTSSGKVQRPACRARFLGRLLDEVARWEAPATASPDANAAADLGGAPAAAATAPTASAGAGAEADPGGAHELAAPGPAVHPEAEVVERWLRAEIAARAHLDTSEVDAHEPFTSYGLDSVQAIEVAGALGEWLGRDVEPTLAWDYPTIAEAARYLAGDDLRTGAEGERSRPEARARIAALERSRSEPIAVVGIGCRFPGGSAGPDGFWEQIMAGRSAISEVPPQRWDVDAYYDPDPDAPGKMATRFAGFLSDVDLFDAPFFGISPREAALMDPQQRLLMEVAWEALEHAGIPPERLSGSPTGVFVGISTNEYLQRALKMGDPTVVGPHAGTGNALSVAANRLSYFLGSQGPSMAIDTACSSSLVAVHLACQSLRSGESDLALAGGVNLLLVPETMINFSRARMLSPEGLCRTFDAAADGYVRGEGCGVVVLRRLSDATAAGEQVLAVIRGSAVNQDGRSNGLTAPNGPSQEAVIRSALAAAGVEPSDVGYVEAHGTGTPLGDPIELRALARVLSQGRPATRPVVVGSVKTNIGHLEAAAGIAGLIKAVLALRNGAIPPHLNFSTPNPHVPWDEIPVVVPTSARGWDAPRRVAGVSSFGFGGTNAHVVLESADPAPAERLPEPEAVLVKLATRGEEAMAQAAGALGRFVAARPGLHLGAVAASADRGRAELPERAAVVASSAGELEASLLGLAGRQAAKGVARGRAPSARAKVAFVIPGQGARMVGAGADAYRAEPAFARAIDTLAEVLGPRNELPLAALLEPGPDSEAALGRTEVAQPSLYALAWSLAQWWEAAGVTPDVVLGHSVGAYAAAAIAGVFSPAEGAALVKARGAMMGALPPGGAMAAVFADEQTVSGFLSPALSLAAVNSASEVVLSGPKDDVAAALAALAASGVATRALVVSHAFHSALMDPVLPALSAEVGRSAPRAPSLAWVSDTTARLVGEEAADPAYWVAHARRPVRFADALRTLSAEGPAAVIELGPSANMIGLASSVLAAAAPPLLASLRPGQGARRSLLEAAGAAWAGGVPLAWDRLSPSSERVSLPTYPFQRRRHWLPEPRRQLRPGAGGLGLTRVPTPLAQVIAQCEISLASVPLLSEHVVHGHVVVPGVVYLELVLDAAALAGVASPVVSELELRAPLVIDDPEPRTIQVVVEPGPGGTASVEVHSCTEVAGEPTTWTLHATAHLAPAADGTSGDVGSHETPEQLRSRLGDPIGGDDLYREAAERGLDYGAAFRRLVDLRTGQREALGTLDEGPLPHMGREPSLHPVVADAGLQALGAAAAGEGRIGLLVPTGMETARVQLRGARPTHVYVTVREVSTRGGADAIGAPPVSAVVGDVRWLDGAGRVVAAAEGVRLRSLDRTSMEALTGIGDRSSAFLCTVEWRDSPLLQGAEAPTADGGGFLLLGREGPAEQRLAEAAAAAGVAVVGGAVVAGAALIGGGLPQGGTTVPVAVGEAAVEAAREQVRAVLDRHPGLDGVVFLSGFDEPAPDATANRSVRGEEPALGPDEAIAYACLLGTIQAVAGGTPSSPAPRLWVVTRSAQQLDAEEPSVGAAPLLGLARTAQLEHPNLRLTCVDLDETALGADGVDSSQAASTLFDELLARDDGERQIAWRAGLRRVARLVPFERAVERNPVPADATGGGGGGAGTGLEIARRGSLDELALRPRSRRAPGALEVEIGVRAAGLNFRDVLNALGMYAGEAVPLGGECAGVVVAVGDAVAGLGPGDEVLAIAAGAFADHVTVDARLVARKPEGLGFEEAAALPIAFLTARHALVALAGLQPGERVLIHSAAGGVGTAALQVAVRMGAEVFATAGNDEKRRFVETLGAAHVMDSRSLSFADRVLELTGGAGVDVVLNSLAGDYVAAGLSVLRGGGRFIEIGKSDVWDDERLQSLGRDVSYQAFDLAQICREEPERVAVMLADLVGDLATGALRPLPHRSFPLSRATEAFRHMAQARHIGKVVLVPDRAVAGGDTTGTVHRARVVAGGGDHDEVVGDAAAADRATGTGRVVLRDDATYLVTGGLGDLGGAVASWMIGRGARHLVLVGRSAPEIGRDPVRESIAAGTQVITMRADVADVSSLERVLAYVDAHLPPLAGIVHAAGVLDDATVLQQSWERFATVFSPKGQGAWNLHRMTEDRDLDVFVLFSSAAAVLGSPGQANYAAANAFLDAVARLRRARGLVATSVDWGPWEGSAMAERATGGWGAGGVAAMSQDQALDVLGAALAAESPQLVAVRANWSEVAERFAPASARLLDEVLAEGGTVVGRTSRRAELVAQLADLPAEARREWLVGRVVPETVRVLGLPTDEQLDPRRPLSDLGMDSLMGVELSNVVGAMTGLELSATLLFDYPTVEALCNFVLESLFPDSTGMPEPSAAEALRAAKLEEIESLDDEEAAALIDRSLALLLSADGETG